MFSNPSRNDGLGEDDAIVDDIAVTVGLDLAAAVHQFPDHVPAALDSGFGARIRKAEALAKLLLGHSLQFG